MKSISKQCPNGHGAMKRCYVKTNKERVQSWHTVPWQYCPECGMILPE